MGRESSCGARLRRMGRRSFPLAAVSLLAAVLAMPSPSHGAVTTPSAWFGLAGRDVRITAAAVHAHNGLVVADSLSDGLIRLRTALVLQRRGAQTRLVARVPLPTDMGSLVGATADRQGRWLLLSRPDKDGAPQFGVSRVTRLTIQGRVDTTFGVSGAAMVNGEGSGIASDGSGRIVVLTSTSASSPAGSAIPVLTRLTGTGAIDDTFNGSGTVDVLPDLERAASLARRPAGELIVASWSVTTTKTNRILVAGMITNVAGGSVGYLTQTMPDGSRDTSFGSESGTTTYGPYRADPMSPASYGFAVASEPLFGNVYVFGRPTADNRDITWKRTARGLRNGAVAVHGRLRPATSERTVQASATCTGGTVQTTAHSIRVTTRAGRPDRSYGPNGVISVAPMSPLSRIDAAAADARTCSLNHLSASERIRNEVDGVTVMWTSLPTP